MARTLFTASPEVMLTAKGYTKVSFMSWPNSLLTMHLNMPMSSKDKSWMYKSPEGKTCKEKNVIVRKTERFRDVEIKDSEPTSEKTHVVNQLLKFISNLPSRIRSSVLLHWQKVSYD